MGLSALLYAHGWSTRGHSAYDHPKELWFDGHVRVCVVFPESCLSAGCTHFIIGRDMAGSKSSVTGEDFYGAYDAQNYAAEMAPALGMQTVPSLNIVYTEEKGYVTADISKEAGLHELKLSGECCTRSSDS